MRKVQLLLVCLVLSVAASAADKVVKLPKPNLSRAGTVMKALSERQSTREYASKALSLLTCRIYCGLLTESIVRSLESGQLHQL
mgnify:CR=1 FL=1